MYLHSFSWVEDNGGYFISVMMQSVHNFFRVVAVYLDVAATRYEYPSERKHVYVNTF